MKSARIILPAAIPGLMFCLVPIHGIDFRGGWQLASIWLAGVVFACWLESWWWRLFFLCVLISVAGREPLTGAYLSLFTVGIFLAAIQGFASCNTERVMDALCVTGLALTIWTMLQRSFDLSTFGLGGAGAGPFNIDAAGALLAMCVPAFFRRGSRWLKCPVALLPFPLFGIALCGATTGVLACLAGIGVWVVTGISDRRWIVVAVVVMLVAGCAALKYESGNLRWRAWRHVVWSYRSAPLGRGLGSFGDLFPLMIAGDKALCTVTRGDDLGGGYYRLQTNKRWTHAHNEFLETGFELGIPAMLLVLSYLAFPAIVAWALMRAGHLSATDRMVLSGMAATATAAAGFYIFHIAPVALAGCAWIGLARRFEPGTGELS
jgi:hypothetical protein